MLTERFVTALLSVGISAGKTRKKANEDNLFLCNIIALGFE